MRLADAACVTLGMCRPLCAIFRRALAPSDLELSGVDPACLNQRPEVLRDALEHVVVGHPAIAADTATRSPGIADKQRAGGFRAAGACVLDLQVVVVADRHDG